MRAKGDVTTINNIIIEALRIHKLEHCHDHNPNESLVLYDEDFPLDDDNVEHGYYDEDELFDIEYEKIMKNLSLMANFKDYMSGGKEWILDSGCTDHMTGDREMFEEITPNHGPRRYVTFGDNSKGKVLGLGKVAISHDSSIQNVMLVESLGYNLLSVSRLADFGFNVLFTKVDCQVFRQDNHKMVFTGIRRGDLYIVDFTKRSKPRTCLIAKSSKGWLWHRRLGHVGMRNLDKLIKGDHILGVKDVIFDKDRLCSACQAGKQVGGNHPVKNIMTTRRPLELLHMDLFGPNAYKSLGGNSYGLVIVDDFSRFTWVFFLDDKS
jgi:hypothetical protein